MGHVVDSVTGCWLWSGPLSDRGYPVENGRSAIRAAWERHHGRTMPAHCFPDHRCRRPRCVRPQHLEAVTKSENEKRKNSRYRLLYLTRCPEGHEVAKYGRATPEGGNVCTVCCPELAANAV